MSSVWRHDYGTRADRNKAYLKAMEEFYEVQEAQEKTRMVAAEFLAVDLGVVGLSYLAYRKMQRRGGHLGLWSRRLRTAGSLAGVTSAVGTLALLGMGYNGVRELQSRRLSAWQEDRRRRSL